LRQKRIALSDKSLQLSPFDIVRSQTFDGVRKNAFLRPKPFGFLRRAEKVSKG
jgi:hypothetical protein